MKKMELPSDATVNEKEEYHYQRHAVFLGVDPIRSAYEACLTLQYDRDNPWIWHNLSIGLMQIEDMNFLPKALGCSNRALFLMQFNAALDRREKIIQKLNMMGVLSSDYLSSDSILSDNEFEQLITDLSNIVAKHDIIFDNMKGPQQEKQAKRLEVIRDGVGGIILLGVIFYFVNLWLWIEIGLLGFATLGIIMEIIEYIQERIKIENNVILIHLISK